MKTAKPVRRTASKKGNLRIGGKTYPLGNMMAKKTVGIVVDENGLVGIWCDNQSKPYTGKAIDCKDGQWCRLLDNAERAEIERKQEDEKKASESGKALSIMGAGLSEAMKPRKAD